MKPEKYPFKLPKDHEKLSPGQLFGAAMKAGLGKNNSGEFPPKPWSFPDLAEKIDATHNQSKRASRFISESTIKAWKHQDNIPVKFRMSFFRVLTPEHRIPSTHKWAQAFKDCWGRWQRPKKKTVSKRKARGQSIKPNRGDFICEPAVFKDILLQIAESVVDIGDESFRLLLLSKDVLKSGLPWELAKLGQWDEERSQNIAFRLLINTSRLAIGRLLIDMAEDDAAIYSIFDRFRWSEISDYINKKQKAFNINNISDPKRFSVVVQLQKELARFDFQIGASASKQVQSYFISAYWTEWRRLQGQHNQFLGSIFADSARISADIALKSHHDWLLSEVHRPLFSDEDNIGGEPFSISDIYVDLPLHPEKFASGFLDLDKELEARRRASELIRGHTNSLDVGSDSSRFLIIRGGPGSGKSSILKYNAAHLLEQGDTLDCAIVYLPLQRHGPFLETDQAFVVRGEILPGFTSHEDGINLLQSFQNSSFKHLIVMLDGLDELGEFAGQKDQVKAVSRLLNIIDKSNDFDNVAFVISGRDQAFRNLTYQEDFDSYTYRLIGMSVEEIEDKSLASPTEPQEGDYYFDLRREWLEKYCRYVFVDQSLVKLTKDDFLSSFGGLDDLTREPLLLYLLSRVTVDIANSNKGVSFPFGKIFDVTREYTLNRNDIYDLLIESIRFPRHRQMASIEQPFSEGGLPEREFRDVLSCLAIAAWRNGSGRRATVGEFLEEAKNNGLEVQAERFIANSKSSDAHRLGLSLLSVFYFQSFKTDGSKDDEFEFTHKSFASFLVAVTLFDRAIGLVDQIRRDGTANSASIFQNWVDIIGNGTETDEVFSFLQAEAERYCRKNHIALSVTGPLGRFIKERLEKRGNSVELADLESNLNGMIQFGYSTANPGGTGNEYNSSSISTQKRAMRILFGVWGVMLSAKKTKATESYRPKVLQIEQVLRSALDPAISDRMDITNSYEIETDFASCSMRGIDFDEVDFSGLNLIAANFSNSNLRNAHFETTVACMAEFEKAEMKGLEIQTCNFNSARFYQCFEFSLYDCLARNGIFEHCNFVNNKFIVVDFSSSDLMNCRFENCEFHMVRFNFVTFENCEFDACKFTMCEFEDTENENSQLKNCTFENCSKEGLRN